jgi:hypothetical protein
VPGLKGGARPGKKKALAAFIQSESAEGYFAGEDVTLEAPAYLAEALKEEQKAVLASYAVVSLPEAIRRIENPRVDESKGNMPGLMDFLLRFECESLLGQVEQLFPKPALFSRST